jgi:hypothetical protein
MKHFVGIFMMLLPVLSGCFWSKKEPEEPKAPKWHTRSYLCTSQTAGWQLRVDPTEAKLTGPDGQTKLILGQWAKSPYRSTLMHSWQGVFEDGFNEVRLYGIRTACTVTDDAGHPRKLRFKTILQLPGSNAATSGCCRVVAPL